MSETAGYIRPGNQRKYEYTTPLPGETVFFADRKNPTLGNPYELKNHKDMAERLRVIAAFKVDFDKDIAQKGKMFQACQQLAVRVQKGEKLLAMCWCHPKPCHVDVIINQVKLALKELNPQHPFLQEKPNTPAPTPKPAQVQMEF
jgi:hypothetical protein